MSSLGPFQGFVTDPSIKYKSDSVNKTLNIYKIEDSKPPQIFD